MTAFSRCCEPREPRMLAFSAARRQTSQESRQSPNRGQQMLYFP